MSDLLPIEKIERVMKKRKARCHHLPSSLVSARITHKSTPTKLCPARKASRKAGPCVIKKGAHHVGV